MIASILGFVKSILGAADEHDADLVLDILRFAFGG